MSGFDTLHVPTEDKEAGFVYRWVNTKDRNILDRKWRGWEVCEYDKPETQLGRSPLAGQATDAPTGGITRQRGDLVLMRMPQAVWDESTGKAIRQARERQSDTFDAMVDSANGEMRNRAKQAGLQRIPQQLVFREASEPDFQSNERTA